MVQALWAFAGFTGNFGFLWDRLQVTGFGSDRRVTVTWFEMSTFKGITHNFGFLYRAGHSSIFCSVLVNNDSG